MRDKNIREQAEARRCQDSINWDKRSAKTWNPKT